MKKKWLIVIDAWSGAEHKYLLSDKNGDIRRRFLIETEGSNFRMQPDHLISAPIEQPCN